MNQIIKTVRMSPTIFLYKIKENGLHTGLYDKNNKWVTWLTQKDKRELIDLGVKND